MLDLVYSRPLIVPNFSQPRLEEGRLPGGGRLPLRRGGVVRVRPEALRLERQVRDDLRGSQPGPGQAAGQGRSRRHPQVHLRLRDRGR